MCVNVLCVLCVLCGLCVLRRHEEPCNACRGRPPRPPPTWAACCSLPLGPLWVQGWGLRVLAVCETR